MFSMSVEAQPLAHKPTNTDGTWNDVVTPSKRWRINRSATTRFAFIILAVILIILILLLLVGTALAVYYGVAYSKCREDKQQTPFESFSGKDTPHLKISPKENVRLQKTVFPRWYDVVLQAHLNKSNSGRFFFNGSVSIKLYCQESTEHIFLHAHYDLNVSKELMHMVALSNDDPSVRKPIQIKNVIYERPFEWYQIELSEKLKSEAMYELIIPQFYSNLTQSLSGWYLSTYIQNGSIKYLATSQLQPTDARRVFPCLDEPEFKAQFQISIIRQKEYQALGNMPLQSSTSLDDDWYLDRFEPTVKMSTYLLAFIVSQFKSESIRDEKGRTITLWARPDKIHMAAYALDVSKKIFEFFEDYFGIPYPLNKTDMVAVPDFKAGAMENWGLITYREESLLFNPESNTASERQRIAIVITHELAHQWFGNLVTMNWWDDVWLNEGFASFAESLGVGHIHPEFQMDEQYLVTDIRSALVSDSSSTSQPVVRPVHYPSEIIEMFQTIAYKKGSSILRMVQAFLGKSTFKQAVKNYLHEHQYQNTNHKDLWRAFTAEAKRAGKNYDVSAIMDNWMKQGNYPLVTVKRVGPTKFRFEQTHFLNTNDTNSTAFKFNWQIPITYGSANTTDWDNLEVIWLKDKSMTVDLPIPPNSWYLINIKQTGFYRVHYADSNWELLTAQLHENHSVIPTHCRIQLLSDLSSLSHRGNVKYSVYLKMIAYMAEENNFASWWMVHYSFGLLNRMLAPFPIYGQFTEFFQHLVDKPLQQVDWTTTREDTQHTKHRLKELIVDIACMAYHPVCLKKSSEMFSEWMNNPSVNKIPSSIRYKIYCSAVQHGGRAEWEFLRGQLTSENKARVCSALLCTHEFWLLKRTIDDPTCGADILDTSVNNLVQPIIWDKFVSHWKALKENINSTNHWSALNRYQAMLKSQPQSISTDLQLKQLEILPKIHIAEVENMRHAFRSWIGEYKNWIENHVEIITNWLMLNSKTFYHL